METDTDDTEREAPTRRDYLTYGSTIVGGWLLAGCSDRHPGDSPPTSTEVDTTTGADSPLPTADTATATGTETAAPGDDSYAVTLAPVGEVTFESVPEDVFAVFPWYADMALALGHGDSINSMWWGQGFGPIVNCFVGALDGVSVDWADLSGSYGATKERLYELDSDVHHVDPAWLSTREGWDPYPDSPEGERLFDRGRVRDIIDGDL